MRHRRMAARKVTRDLIFASAHKADRSKSQDQEYESSSTKLKSSKIMQGTSCGANAGLTIGEFNNGRKEQP